MTPVSEHPLAQPTAARTGEGGRRAQGRGELTIRDQVLGDVQGDFDDQRAADVRGAHEADDTAGDADQHQGGLVDGTPGRAH